MEARGDGEENRLEIFLEDSRQESLDYEDCPENSILRFLADAFWEIEIESYSVRPDIDREGYAVYWSVEEGISAKLWVYEEDNCRCIELEYYTSPTDPSFPEQKNCISGEWDEEEISPSELTEYLWPA